ncbi:glycosyltransferase [Flavobacteriaceae bacterium S356]|uniref:Glycosyltransferase n=1 Tax=Asprobacillus argus TaxID=3076534 RepID=A0ABU3LD44_9FLAO|nr:glycosyltransferase [Flavobacteriaceae bacterium S356]
MKVAIVHYWFITRRGGEKVVESMLKLFPNADIYTLFYDPKAYGDYLKNNNVHTSSLNNSFLRKHYQKIFPLYPMGISSLKLKEKYDLIISSESGPAKGIKNIHGVPHICYIHSPMRYCWSHKNMYVEAVNPLLRPFMSFFLERLRKWDKKTVNNVDLYISNSKNVADRVAKYYHRTAEIVYPPIAEELFEDIKHVTSVKTTYLSFGAITPYKKIDLLIDTFNKNGKSLIVVGEGSEREKLEKKAKENITFMGEVDWKRLREIIYNSKALLFPGEEDFGMIPLEVMAHGIPVIAFKKGGALETVVEDKDQISKSSGIFFEKQTEESLERAIMYFEDVEDQFDSLWIRDHAGKFAEDQFLLHFRSKVDDLLNSK